MPHSYRSWPLTKSILLYTSFIVISLILLLPIFWMISTSFKSQGDVFDLPIQWIPDEFLFSNYSEAWSNPHGGTTFTRYTVNSMIVAGVATVLHVLLASLAGFGLAKYAFFGRKALLVAILATLMLPLEVIMVPLFLTVRDLGWLDSYQGIIVPLVAEAFGVFVMRQYYLALPDSLIDAALVDGAGHVSIFFRVAVPLSWPAIAVVAIFIFRETWDDFLWSLLVVQSGEMRTLPLGIRTFFSAELSDFGQIMAVSTLAYIPLVLLFLVFQRAFIQGIAETGLRG